MRFERDGAASRSLASEDDSDGAVSAPELPPSHKQQQQQLQQLQQKLQMSQNLDEQIASFHARMSAATPSVFTAAEYKAWMQRAPSTSAIYERLRQSREALEAQRAAKLTFSAENITDKTKQVKLFFCEVFFVKFFEVFFYL